MTALDVFKRIARRFPDSGPHITELPSGAAMLDLTIGGTRYCVEYLPGHATFGLSKIAGSTPFWEGVEESFGTAEELEARIVEIEKRSK